MKHKNIALVVAATISMSAFGIITGGAHSKTANDFDAAATYKSKCVACHGAKAEKKYDATIADDLQVQIILKGKKMEKPPHMPGYESKGITEDQAKALVAHMKSLKQ